MRARRGVRRGGGEGGRAGAASGASPSGEHARAHPPHTDPHALPAPHRPSLPHSLPPPTLAPSPTPCPHVTPTPRPDSPALSDTEAVKQRKLEALHTALGMYRRWLGLSFEHGEADGERLLVALEHVGAAAGHAGAAPPPRASFAVQVVGDNSYQGERGLVVVCGCVWRIGGRGRRAGARRSGVDPHPPPPPPLPAQ